MTTSDRDHSRRPPRNGRGRFIRAADVAARDADAVRLRTQGWTYDRIATELGYTDRANARRAVETALVATVAEPATELRALEVMRLDELWRRAWEVLERDHLVVQLGKVVKGEDGEALVDQGPVLQAIDRLLKISERRAKLLGLDAPTKIEAITVGQIDAEIARLTAELGMVDQQGGDEQ